MLVNTTESHVSMSIAQTLLPEFDHEMATTRTMLAAVPNDRAQWQPHGKSMSIARLAMHITSMPNWGLITLQQDEFDLNPPDGSRPPVQFESTAATIERFDSLVKKSRAVLAATSDAEMMAPWTLKNAGHTVFIMPKAAVFRSFVMNHMIHHRGQLSVYLRLLDVPVPPAYGPTADSAA